MLYNINIHIPSNLFIFYFIILMSCKSGTPFCYPSNLFDYLLALIMPPLYVIIHEFRRGFENPMNIFRNL